MPERSWKLRLTAALEILLALGFATDWIAVTILDPLLKAGDPLGSVSSLAAVTTLSSLLLLALLTALQRVRAETLGPVLLGGSRNLRGEAGRGLLLVPAVFALVYLLKSGIRHVSPGIYSGERNVLEDLMRGPGDLLLFLFVALFTGGIKEEVQRAFILRRFESGWGPGWLGALLFALFFGAGHLIQGRDEALIAGVVGLVWGFLYVTRRNIVVTSVSHGLYDALELARYYYFGPMHYL